jgi:hypothetical protein
MDHDGAVGMHGELRVKVKRGGAWYRRVFFALFIDWRKGGRVQ